MANRNLWVYVAVAVMTRLVFTQASHTSQLEFLDLSSPTSVPRSDDGASSRISITPGFPLRDGTTQYSVYVGTNGVFSFGSTFISTSTSPFSSTSAQNYVIAPFWSDIDISRGYGNIKYQSYYYNFDGSTARSLLNQVSTFINGQLDTSFSGTWMLVAEWDQVPEYSESTSLRNSFQGILITDGSNSYTVFTYECGSMDWSDEPTVIGYKINSFYYINHYRTGSNANQIACITSPTTNVVYQLSSLSATVCDSDEFECDGACVANYRRCDGINDCSDLSDEYNCNSCSGFECDNGVCLFDSDRCDDIDDCGDNSDEDDCGSAAVGLALGIIFGGGFLLCYVCIPCCIGIMVYYTSRKSRVRRPPVTRTVTRPPPAAAIVTTSYTTQDPERTEPKPSPAYPQPDFGAYPKEPPPPYPGPLNYPPGYPPQQVQQPYYVGGMYPYPTAEVYPPQQTAYPTVELTYPPLQAT